MRLWNRTKLSLSAALLLVLSFLLPTRLIWAAEEDAGRFTDKLALAVPQSAVLWPGGGRLEVEDKALLRTQDQETVACFLIPAEAANLQLSVPGQTVLRWAASWRPVPASSELGRRREDVLQLRDLIQSDVESLASQLSLWKYPVEKSNLSDLEQHSVRLREVIPPLARRKADLEQRLLVIQQELQRLEENQPLAQLVTVVLQKAPASGTVDVRYSYTLRNCGWQPVYSFDALPDAGEIRVRLMAEVWQYSGLDWSGTRLTLSSQGDGPREPAPVRPWVVESQRPMPLATPRARQEAEPDFALAQATGLVEARAMKQVPQHAQAVGDLSGVYALWTPAAPGLPEGRLRQVITSDVWKAPLQWLARPSKSDNRVWLMAEAVLPGDRGWPAGTAEFLVNGQNVGEGSFRPEGDSVTLFFGADPRVSVKTVADTRQRGESGFLGKSRNWTWGWTYTLVNGHAKPVNVRLERPLPQIVDQDVSVSYDNKPAAQEDKEKQLLIWNVEVPGKGKASVRHALTISSPRDLPLSPAP